MDIIGYEKQYTIDREGNVFGKKRKKIRNPTINQDGYLHINLWKNGNNKTITIHRLIATHFIPNPDNLPLIDHKNGITTDNRIENLRWVNNSQNGMNSKKQKNNTTGYTGVVFRKNRNRFVAQIYLDNERLYIGSYKTALEASQAYEAKALELFGEFKREII